MTLLARLRTGSPVQWRRSMRRGLKVSAAALGGALACVLIAVGGIDGARLSAGGAGPGGYVATMGLAMIMVVVFVACLRRLQFVTPAARAQRVSFWLSSATDLADI